MKEKKKEKYCVTCEEIYPIENFYRNLNRCKKCYNQEHKNKELEKKIQQGGSLKVPQYPNKYFDQYQKQTTFELMEKLNYLYNEEFGIWTKPGWKEILDGEPFFPNIQFKKIERKKKRKVELKINMKYIPDEILSQMISYFEEGKSFVYISKKFKYSPPTIAKYIRQYYESKTC